MKSECDKMECKAALALCTSEGLPVVDARSFRALLPARYHCQRQHCGAGSGSTEPLEKTLHLSTVSHWIRKLDRCIPRESLSESWEHQTVPCQLAQ